MRTGVQCSIPTLIHRSTKINRYIPELIYMATSLHTEFIYIFGRCFTPHSGIFDVYHGGISHSDLLQGSIRPAQIPIAIVLGCVQTKTPLHASWIFMQMIV